MWRHTTSPACWKTHGSIYASSSSRSRCSLRIRQHSLEGHIKRTTRPMAADQVLTVLRTDLGTEYVEILHWNCAAASRQWPACSSHHCHSCGMHASMCVGRPCKRVDLGPDIMSVTCQAWHDVVCFDALIQHCA